MKKFLCGIGCVPVQYDQTSPDDTTAHTVMLRISLKRRKGSKSSSWAHELGLNWNGPKVSDGGIGIMGPFAKGSSKPCKQLWIVAVATYSKSDICILFCLLAAQESWTDSTAGKGGLQKKKVSFFWLSFSNGAPCNGYIPINVHGSVYFCITCVARTGVYVILTLAIQTCMLFSIVAVL